MGNEDDYVEDPAFLDYANRALQDVVPKLQDSAVTLSLVPDEPTDIKYALELGLAMMMDKPLILVVQPDVHVGRKLTQAADAIVEWSGNIDQDQKRIADAIALAMAIAAEDE